jgi:hypothetical protein
MLVLQVAQDLAQAEDAHAAGATHEMGWRDLTV